MTADFLNKDLEHDVP